MDDYELLEPLGVGGMGTVYRARQRSLGRFVAIKLLRQDDPASPVRYQRFAREAQTMARLNHPGIIKILDFGRHGEHLFYAMELHARGLQRVLETSPERIRSRAPVLMEHLLAAVAVVHAEGIIHRDIKESNVLLSDEDLPVLSDFGLVTETAREVTALTLPGTVVGTLLYMAPEILRSGRYSAASDVWALGVLYYRLLTGEYPVWATDIRSFVYAATRLPHRDIRELRPDIDAGTVEFLDRCLAKEPAERLADGAAAHRAFLRLVMRRAGARGPGGRQRAPVAAARGSSQRGIAVIALLVGVLGGLGWLLRPDAPATPAQPSPAVQRAAPATSDLQRALTRVNPGELLASFGPDGRIVSGRPRGRCSLSSMRVRCRWWLDEVSRRLAGSGLREAVEAARGAQREVARDGDEDELVRSLDQMRQVAATAAAFGAPLNLDLSSVYPPHRGPLPGDPGGPGESASFVFHAARPDAAPSGRLDQRHVALDLGTLWDPDATLRALAYQVANLRAHSPGVMLFPESVGFPVPGAKDRVVVEAQCRGLSPLERLEVGVATDGARCARTATILGAGAQDNAFDLLTRQTHWYEVDRRFLPPAGRLMVRYAILPGLDAHGECFIDRVTIHCIRAPR